MIRLTGIFVLMAIVFAGQSLAAQKILQVEKKNSPKTRKFYIGDEIVFRLDDEKSWYTRTIRDIRPEEGIILVEDGIIRLDEITSLKNVPGSQAGTTIGNMLLTFGLGWVLFSVIDSLADEEKDFTLGLDQFSIPALGSGALVRGIWGDQQFKIGDKWRLRLLDISFGSQ